VDSHRGVAQPWDRRPHEPGRRHCHHRRVASRYEGKHVKHRQQTEGVLGGRQIHSRPPAPRRRASSPATNANQVARGEVHSHVKFSSYRKRSTHGAVGDGVLYDVTVRAIHRAQTCVYLRKTQGLGGCLAWRTPLRLHHARARIRERERTARVSSLPLPRRPSPCHKSAGLARAPQHAARLSLTTCRPAPGSSRC
jgi:hypothetical protein